MTPKPTTQVVDRTLPAVEEGNMEDFEAKPMETARLRQSKMYQFVCQQSQQETIAEHATQTTTTPTARYCAKTKENTTVHGHYHRSGIEIMEDGLFRVYYNNVNGLSPQDDNNDTKMFIKSISNKECAIVAITEPNCNFDKQAMR